MEVLIVIALVAFFMVMWASGGLGFLGGGGKSDRADGEGKTLVGKSLLAGKDTKCRSNISQVRMSIEIARDPSTDQAPSSLAETRLGADFYSCAVGGETYEYDPATGDVSCPHPGHDKY
ncbi:MAG: hypothetical protein IH944_09885 [Armatimonadetes bacterium]|nr:hypothetical protein [Armatimonadota bacterium]